MTTGTIYLDNNATTRLDPRVLQAMLPFLRERYGNPSSTHAFGSSVMSDIEEARVQVAAMIRARGDEILFTGGGTEANNTALRSTLAGPRKKLVISAIEHSSAAEPADQLAREGRSVVRVRTEAVGVIDLANLRAIVDDQTALVSIMLVNNETGAIQPVVEAAEIAHRAGALLHVDAVQSPGRIPLDVRELGADLLTLSAHKLHGPKGVGALYVREGTPFRPLIVGGPQERERRGGTLNAAAIVGFGAAASLVEESLAEVPRVAALRDRLERELVHLLPGARVIAGKSPRVCNTTCLLLQSIEAEPLLMLLSEAGVCASSGAACSSGSLEPSRVLLAMGIPAAQARGQLRLSLSRETTEAEIDLALRVITDCCQRIARLEGAA